MSRECCPSCGTRVLPMDDGTCPACREVSFPPKHESLESARSESSNVPPLRCSPREAPRRGLSSQPAFWPIIALLGSAVALSLAGWVLERSMVASLRAPRGGLGDFADYADAVNRIVAYRAAFDIVAALVGVIAVILLVRAVAIRLRPPLSREPDGRGS